MLGAHHDDLEIVVILDLGDGVVVFEHVLVEQIAQREIFRIVADRHHGDDLLRVEIQRQRPLDRDLDLGVLVPVWSMPVTRSVSRGSSGLGTIRGTGAFSIFIITGRLA